MDEFILIIFLIFKYKHKLILFVTHNKELASKYASRIIAQEGKDINEVDVKGLEIKRSEIPQRSQRMLKDILNVILDESNTKQQIKSKVDTIAKQAKDDICKLASEGDLTVAKVVSYSKKIDEYKVMPQHLLGMLTWNELCGKEEFKYGSKGKLFNVLGIDLNKAPKNVVDNYYNNYLKKFPNTPIESIVIPEGVDRMPDYFAIDMPKTVEYCCDDRFELIMSGLYVESDVDLLF
jgi:DNA polymerase elongation subunit (family B)